MKNCDILIIGAGPAGMAAALEAYNSGIKDIVIIERDKEAGGILNQCVHSGFGIHRFGAELTGPEYAEKYIDMLKSTDVTLKVDTLALGIEENGSKKIVSVISEKDGFEQIEAKAVILAMGCRERNRGPLFVPGGRGRGVFTAGAAQKYLNMEGYLIGKRVVILGSGDIGLIMARRLTLEGADVLAVVEMMPFSNGLSRNVVQCLEDFDIPLYLSHTVTNVIGKTRLEGVVISQVDENLKPIPGTEKVFDCDTLLLSAGLVPENEITREAGIELDSRTGGAKVNEDMETSKNGIFACGNVLHIHDLVDFVSEESARAGKSAAEYILSNNENGGKKRNAILNGLNVVYTVPQRFLAESVDDNLNVYFRVRTKLNASEIRVSSKDEVLATYKRDFLLPAEMEKISIAREILERANGDITVSVVEVGEGL